MDPAVIGGRSVYRAFFEYMSQEFVPTTMPLWVWFVGCTFALIMQCGWIILTAPLWTGLTNCLSASLKGEPSFPITSRWRDIWHQCYKPSLHDKSQDLNRLLIFCAFVLVLPAAIFIPVCTLTVNGFPVPNLLFICSLLVGATLMLILPLATQGYFSAVKASVRLLGEGLLLPALIPIFFLSGGRNLRSFFTQIYTLSPLTDGAAYVLAGGAICVVGVLNYDEGSDVSDYDSNCLPLTGIDKGVWLLTSDCIKVCWLTLAVDIMWPTSLAMPMVVPGATLMSQWFGQCVESVGLWICKMGIAALLLAGVRLVVVSSTRMMQIKIGTVFLLGVLAWQMAYTYTP